MDPNVNREYEEAEREAKIKLAQIIEREGDAGGERTKPYYLESLILEAIGARHLSNLCMRTQRTRSKEIKKEMPAT
ncbi:MAG: hypothetical protein IJX94_01165 [Clostridia bacterium]|nr:hypothetical protein [Clostridia bacterium]